MTDLTNERNKLIKTVNPYELPSKPPKNKKQYEARPTAVPNLDDVQPFMSVPDFVEKPGSELEALLASQHIQNPYPYPGNVNALPSYSAEPPESAYLRSLREYVKHALAHAWKYDPFRCSVKGAFKVAQESVGRPNQGFAKEEYSWATGGKLMIVKKARSAARADVEQARNSDRWTKKLDEDDESHGLDGTELDRQIDEFYGPDGIVLRPIDDDSDEGFSEPNPLTITIVSLPDKSPMEDGVTPGGIHQDSGISMDESYAEYSLAYSPPNTAKESTGKAPNDWPTFSAVVAPLRVPKSNGRWLGSIGDQKQCEWPGRRQGPYDLDGLRSDDANQMVEGPNSETTHENLLPAEVTLPNEPVQEKVNSEPYEAAPHSFGQEQPSLLHDNDGNSITISVIENNEASVGTSYSANEERPQYSRDPIEAGGDNGLSVPTPHVGPEGLQIDHDASAHARRSIPDTSFTTPLNQRIYQIQQVQLDTPATPAAINLHLTPEYNSDVDVDDASDGSLEVRAPNSPSMNTQKGQSALGRYIQETKSHPELTHHNSSTMSLNGSDSDELSLISTQQRHNQLKGHVGISKSVDLDPKKSDAVFTLSPPKALPATPSLGTTAPIPTTPANGKDPASFRPITPFQLNTPTHPDLDSPGTPTPAPKTHKSKGKSVMNVFRSPKLGSRSPERATPSSEIVVLAPPTIPAAAGGADSHQGSALGSQGLLFQKGKVKERGTMNVLSSLKLSPERGSGGGSELEHGNLDDYEDELAGGDGVEGLFKGAMAKGAHESPLMLRSGGKLGAQAQGGKIVAQAVKVPRVRSRDGDADEEMQSVDAQHQEPRKKKPRRSARTAGGADGGGAGLSFEY